MSSFEDKVIATTDFLRNRASLGRVTNHQELGVVVGDILHRRGQRGIGTPVARNKLRDVLEEVDRRSWGSDGILLSALVPHFWDDKPGKGLRHRLRKFASGQDYDHAVEAVFEHFEGIDGGVLPVDFSPRPRSDERPRFTGRRGSLRDRLRARRESSEFEDFESDVEDLDDEAPDQGNRALTEDRIRSIFREELEKVSSDF